MTTYTRAAALAALAALVASVLLTACGPPPRLVSRCGAEFMGTYPTRLGISGWNDLTFQEIEDRSIEALARTVRNDGRFTQNNICNSLRGVEVFISPEPSMPRALYSPDLLPPTRQLSEAELAYKVAGLSDCLNRKMILTNIPGGVRKSAYAHELAHFAQDCNSRPEPGVVFLDDDAASHSNWYHDRIYEAISEVFNP